MTTDPRYGPAGDGYGHRTWEDLAVAEDHAGWVSRSRVVLTPIAAPSIMGLFGFTIATVMLGSFQAPDIPVRTPVLVGKSGVAAVR